MVDAVDKELREAQARLEGVWDREEARAILSDSMQTIKAAGRIARKAVEIQSDLEVDAREDLNELRDSIVAMKDQGIPGTRHSGLISRAQARDILTHLRRIESSLNVSTIVKLCLDLTNQSRLFMDMMDRVNRIWGDDDRRKAEDLENQLTVDQLLQVYQMIEHNKAERDDEVTL